MFAASGPPSAPMVMTTPSTAATMPNPADADTDRESAAGRGRERGLSLDEKTVQRTGTSEARETIVGSVGQSAPERIIGAAGPAGSQDCRVNGSCRARNQETARGAAVDDASGRGTHHGAGLCAGHRDTGPVSLWQADWQLHRAHSVRGLQCWPATAGTDGPYGRLSLLTVFCHGDQIFTLSPRRTSARCSAFSGDADHVRDPLVNSIPSFPLH
jgi:hypothetical protein